MVIKLVIDYLAGKEHDTVSFKHASNTHKIAAFIAELPDVLQVELIAEDGGITSYYRGNLSMKTQTAIDLGEEPPF